MKNFAFSLVAYLCLAICFTSCGTHSMKTSDKSPNIILILADDMGYNEASCYGQTHFSTPNIDQLAQNGMMFTNFYAGSTVCGPSRASLITGKHPGYASVRGNHNIIETDTAIVLDRSGITYDDKTIAEVLKEKGYKTALCGKWHLEYFNDSLQTWPINRGFDYVIRERWNTELNANRAQYRQETGVIFDYNYPYELWENGQKVTFDGNIVGERRHLMDDIVTDAGLNFMRENKDNPFFVFFSLKIPHNPETFAADTGLFMDKGWPECERVHAVRVLYMDELVKKIVDEVNTLGLAENTLIIFSSDNGGHSEGGYLEPEVDPCKHDHTFFSSNAPFRGYKRDLYDGGIRVPFICAWEGTIKPGQKSDHIGAFWDLMPTFADMAGIEMDYETNGISFLPTLINEEQPKHDLLYWEFFSNGQLKDTTSYGFLQAIRKDEWKAVRYGVVNPIEIYNIKNDPGEQNDLASEYPEMVHMFDSLFKSSRSDHPYYPYGGGINLDIEKDIFVTSF